VKLGIIRGKLDFWVTDLIPVFVHYLDYDFRCLTKSNGANIGPPVLWDWCCNTGPQSEPRGVVAAEDVVECREELIHAVKLVLVMLAHQVCKVLDEELETSMI